MDFESLGCVLNASEIQTKLSKFDGLRFTTHLFEDFSFILLLT